MNAKLLILKNQEGKPCRLLQTSNNQVCLIKNQETKRLELIDSHLVDTSIHRVVHSFDLSTLSQAITIKGVGSLSVLKEGERLPFDPPSIIDEKDQIVGVAKWSTGAHATLVFILILIAKLLPFHHGATDEKPMTLVTIHTDEILKEEPPQQIEKPKMKEKIQALPKKKEEIYVAPRTNKKKSLKVTQSSNFKKGKARKNAPTQFQQMGLLGALSNTIKGSPHGSGSGLKLRGGAAGGGMGRGAGIGQGNGTSGSGSYGSGGGYAQSLSGRGLIAGQVGAGGGGLGSGWGNGTRGSGSFGTKGKAGGHEGFGNSNVGGGVSDFVLPEAEEAIVEGGLDRDVVEAVIARYTGQIRACYERGLQQDPDLRGRVSVSFVISGRGTVKQERINHSSLRSPVVEGCLLGKMRGWKFPNPVGGVNVRVEKSFPLQRVSQR